MHSQMLDFGFPMPETVAGAQLRPFLDAFLETTGIRLTPRWLPTYDDFVAACDRGLDLAWAPPVIAIELEHRGKMRALLAVERRGVTSYHGALVVAKTSTITRTSELVGKRMAWVSPMSAAGYLVPRLHLVSKGLDPRSMFAEERFWGAHAAAVDAVLAGQADAAGVFAHADPRTPGVFRIPHREAELRVLSTAGPIPGDVIMSRATLGEADRQSASAALLSLRDGGLECLRAAMGVECFEPMPRGHLDPLRKLAAFARAPAPPRA